MNWAKQHNSEALVFFHFNMLFQKADTKTYLQVHVDATAKRVTQVSVQQVRIYLRTRVIHQMAWNKQACMTNGFLFYG